MNPGCAVEQEAWREVKDGWRPLYGDVDQNGVAVEWHDFRTERSFDWGRTFHPHSLEFCLNLEGHGEIGARGRVGLFAGKLRLLCDWRRIAGGFTTRARKPSIRYARVFPETFAIAAGAK